MNVIFNRLNATSSPIVTNKRGVRAWLCYDDDFILKINPCGINYNGTYELNEMPIVARGFLVYNIVEKRYSFAERVTRYLTDEKILYNDTYRHFIRVERRNWLYIRLKLFRWLPKEEKQILKKSYKLMKIKAKAHFKNK